MLASTPQRMASATTADQTDASREIRYGWECKPVGKRRGTVVVAAVFLVLGALGPILAIALAESGPDRAAAASGLAVAVAGLVTGLREVLRKGRDYLYLDERGFVRVRRTNDEVEKLWLVRSRDVDDVLFKGGAWIEATLKAEIHGQHLIQRETRPKKSPKDKGPNKVELDFEAMKFHPRLLAWLIGLAEPNARTDKRRHAIERARGCLDKAWKKTPKPIPLHED